jgi:PAS domain S-box-containing protein
MDELSSPPIPAESAPLPSAGPGPEPLGISLQVVETNDPEALRALIQQLPVGMLVATVPEGRVVACNDAYLALCPSAPPLGSSVEEFAGSLGALHPDGRAYEPREFPLVRAIRDGERVDGEEMEAVRASGQLRVLRVSATPIRDPAGRVVLATATVDDITDGRLHREARQAARARDETMSVVSHDLRNSLHAALLSVELVLDVSPVVTPGSPPWKRIAAVRRSLQHMHRLVQDLLEVDRIGRGRLVIHPERLAPARVATEIEEVFGPLARQSGVRLEVRVADGAAAVLADPTRLVQVLNNLISNALHATPAGGEVRIAIEPDAPGWVRFQVSDTGSGMSEQELEQVFDRFYQGATARRTGVGLGLSIVRGIVEAHGGRVSARSRPGAGSTFVFTLPGDG